MTIIYKVQGESSTPQNCMFCRVSVKNIIAFCILREAEISNEIFVCDLITPWQIFKVNSSKNLVTLLEWNSSGELLMIGYKRGLVEIWSSDKILNSWFLLYKVPFSSEDIVGAKFFHNGKSMYFHSQKKDLPLYTDKFERLEYRPTLEYFGSTSAEGAVIVTSSGLLGAFIIPNERNNGENQEGMELTAVTQSIGLSRSFRAFCSISHSPSGQLYIAVSSGRENKVVNCFNVSLKMEIDGNIFIKCESLPSVFIGAGERKQITHLTWITCSKEDAMYIAYACADGGQIEQWHLSKKPQVVHKLLQKNKGEFVQCESWENVAKMNFSAEIADISFNKLQCPNSQLFVVLKDNTVQVVEPGLKKMGVVLFDRSMGDERMSRCMFAAADITFLSQILLVFDNYGQMYAIQTNNPHHDKNFKLNTISQQTSLLEYSIITGVDASDVLMQNLNSLELLIEKLTENFTKQSAFTRHFYYSNFLSLKSNMWRIQSRQQDFDNLIILHTISITFKSLLRPSELNCQDKGPADNLAMILSDPSADIDKILFNLDCKDYTVEPLTLQSLQQLIQWVSDLALNILYKLPNEVIKAKMSKKQGYDISRDGVAISSIRELLVMIRIWGLLNAQCLPTYTKSVENIDVLATLFRLLTRLAQNASEPDDLLLDECSLLSTQVLIPQRQFTNPATLLNCHMSLYKSFPFTFTVAIEPVGLQDIKYEEVVFASSVKDGVSNLQLGVKAGSLRKCVRCGLVNSLQNVAKTAALKAWCQRWLYCHCGGSWKKV